MKLVLLVTLLFIGTLSSYSEAQTDPFSFSLNNDLSALLKHEPTYNGNNKMRKLFGLSNAGLKSKYDRLKRRYADLLNDYKEKGYLSYETPISHATQLDLSAMPKHHARKLEKLRKLALKHQRLLQIDPDIDYFDNSSQNSYDSYSNTTDQNSATYGYDNNSSSSSNNYNNNNNNSLNFGNNSSSSPYNDDFVPEADDSWLTAAVKRTANSLGITTKSDAIIAGAGAGALAYGINSSNTAASKNQRAALLMQKNYVLKEQIVKFLKMQSTSLGEVVEGLEDASRRVTRTTDDLVNTINNRGLYEDSGYFRE